ncbi:MAG: hypothetical protein GXN93_05295 [Candidatus Diapherotrites archaeon]|nr:hypothetical protein [Candidatus Diapherotrites archaeon]
MNRRNTLGIVCVLAIIAAGVALAIYHGKIQTQGTKPKIDTAALNWEGNIDSIIFSKCEDVTTQEYCKIEGNNIIVSALVPIKIQAASKIVQNDTVTITIDTNGRAAGLCKRTLKIMGISAKRVVVVENNAKIAEFNDCE